MPVPATVVNTVPPRVIELPVRLMSAMGAFPPIFPVIARFPPAVAVRLSATPIESIVPFTVRASAALQVVGAAGFMNTLPVIAIAPPVEAIFASEVTVDPVAVRVIVPDVLIFAPAA